MSVIAPNLTVLVGELVGARLIAHAGTTLFQATLTMYCCKGPDLCEEIVVKINFGIATCNCYCVMLVFIDFRFLSKSCKTSVINSSDIGSRKGIISSFEDQT